MNLYLLTDSITFWCAKTRLVFLHLCESRFQIGFPDRSVYNSKNFLPDKNLVRIEFCKKKTNLIKYKNKICLKLNCKNSKVQFYILESSSIIPQDQCSVRNEQSSVLSCKTKLRFCWCLTVEREKITVSEANGEVICRTIHRAYRFDMYAKWSDFRGVSRESTLVISGEGSRRKGRQTGCHGQRLASPSPARYYYHPRWPVGLFSYKLRYSSISISKLIFIFKNLFVFQ